MRVYGGRLRLTNLSSKIKSLFEITKLEKLFEIMAERAYSYIRRVLELFVSLHHHLENNFSIKTYSVLEIFPYFILTVYGTSRY